MTPFRIHTGIVAPMDRPNVDTDQIIPKQFLKRIERTGFGQFLFFDWRQLPDGSPNPDFELNRPEHRAATILLARRNFGCGSSREHAPWALEDFGFRAIVAPSFADIFRTNCTKIGLLPVVLPEPQVRTLIDQTTAVPGATVTVDLTANEVVAPDGQRFAFEIEPDVRERLLNGWDDISLTLAN